MTIFGKIMAIFVFLLSLVWFGLTVNLYATRGEWKRAYDTARKEADRNAKDTEELKKQLQLERAAINGRQVTAQQSVQAIAGQLKEAQDKYDNLLKGQNAGADAVAKDLPFLKEYDATLKKLQKQVGDLTTENSGLTKSRDEYARSAQLSKNAENDARLQVAVLQKALDDLSLKLERLSQIRAAANGGADGTSFRGDVLQVATDGSALSFKGGGNAGVKVGGEYKVYRDTDPYYVGKVTVTVVNPDSSAGNFSPPAGNKATGKYMPQQGDRVEK